ncbi:MAG TPA: hypothetical protein VGP64_13440 [Polyangia bacterium]|jgi:hypothetical protein
MSGVKFGFFVDPDTTRYCGLRLRRLKEAIKKPEVLDALVDELELGGALGNKMAAIDQRIDELCATQGSRWFEVPPPEVLSASIFRAKKLAGAFADDLWKRVSRVQDLSAALTGWLRIGGFEAFTGGAPPAGRANVIGYRGGGMIATARAFGIEATNDPAELDRALEAMKTARVYTNVSYIACTPALIAEYLWARAAVSPRWEAEALGQKLRAAGHGLLLVEGDAVAQAILPQERKPDKAKLAEIASAIMSNDPGRA